MQQRVFSSGCLRPRPRWTVQFALAGLRLARMLKDALKPTAVRDRLSLWGSDMKLTHFAECAPLFALLALVGTEVRAESTECSQNSFCYGVHDGLKAVISTRADEIRARISTQRAQDADARRSHGGRARCLDARPSRDEARALQRSLPDDASRSSCEDPTREIGPPPSALVGREPRQSMWRLNLLGRGPASETPEPSGFPADRRQHHLKPIEPGCGLAPTQRAIEPTVRLHRAGEQMEYPPPSFRIALC